MIFLMFINAIVIILLNIFKKYEKIKNDMDNGNIISLKKTRIIYKIIFFKFFIEKGINIRYNNTIII